MLQADQLTEEQIAGKTWLHWSPTFPFNLQVACLMDLCIPLQWIYTFAF